MSDTRTEAQQEASRQNGSKSQGPITIDGKQRSAQNATKHGLRSPRVVLANENPEKYEKRLAAYVAEWNPVGITESDLLVSMVNARWRIQRIESIIDGTLDNEMFIQKPIMDQSFDHITPAMRQADAAAALGAHNPGTLEYYDRAQERLERIYERSKRQLIQLQTMRLGHAPVLTNEPISLLETPENTNEPDLIGPNFDEIENFRWISRFTPTTDRPTPTRKHWTDETFKPPDEKAA